MWNLATNEEESFDADLQADDDFNLNSKGMSSFRKVSLVNPVGFLKRSCIRPWPSLKLAKVSEVNIIWLVVSL